jgi:hypothetical protein
MPSQQTPLTQSIPVAQPLPSPQGVLQTSMPQSASVSPSFFCVSLHVGRAHIPPEQTLSSQSEETEQVYPAGHKAHAPPQVDPHPPGTQYTP